MASYYIVENNQQAGPFSVEQLAARGITPDTNVWTEGMSNWAPASQVSELQSLFATQSSYQPNTGGGYVSSNAYSQQDYEEPYVPQPKDYKTQSIVLIIVSVFCCGACGGIINLVLGIMALMESNKVQPAYISKNYALAQAASDKAGKYTKIGFIVAGIGLVLEVIFLVICYGAVIIGAMSGEF